MKKPAKLPAEIRRREVLEAAIRLLLAQGSLPLRTEALAREAGVSKALIYAYFPDQHDLFNDLLQRQFEDLAAEGIENATAAGDLEACALTAADIYLGHVARHGPVIHFVLRDAYMAGRERGAVRRFRERIAGRLARLARRDLALPAQEAIGAFNLALAIPEEAGRQVWRGQIPLEDARALCRQLIRASLDSLRPAGNEP